jgi:hypothetical protein
MMLGEAVLPQSPERYARDARLVRRAETIELHLLVWEGGRERHEVREVAADLAVGPPRVVAQGPALGGLSWSSAPRVLEGEALVRADEEAEAEGPRGLERVRVVRSGGVSRVVLARPAAEEATEVTVFVGAATAAAPALACGTEGTWVAFHHNLREDTGEADLTKWIALRFVTADGKVCEPEAPMRDRDRDRTGEEQGFELPSVLVTNAGAVVLLGRGSHRFYRQDLDAHGFSERAPLDDGSWGCRGRRVAAVIREDGTILTARRDKRGIVLAALAAAEGTAPSLRAAEVEPPSRPHRGVPPRPRGPDPAARYGLRTLFGDIHQHSAHSDGCGTAHEPFLRARYVYGDDFCALSDHESFLGKRIGPGEWRYLRAVADAHDDPGTFAALHAYEWTGRMHPGPGHKVVYPLTGEHEIVSRDVEAAGEGLLARLRGEAIAVPHHVGWTGADEAAHDEALQPVWEICSCHGCYLSAGHPLGQRGALVDQMIESVLRRGRRFGFIACSDGHGLLFHHGVGRKRDPFRCGLTAVQATDVSRAAILGAIRARRCYATSGVPIFLDLRADGSPMGSVVGGRGPVSFVIEASGSAPLRELALVGPEGTVQAMAPQATEGRLEVRADLPWAYARVIQEDGEMAWSSPVFRAPT